MNGLRLQNRQFDDLTAALLRQAPLEACAVIYAVHDRTAGAWIARDVLLLDDDAYHARSERAASLTAATVVSIANRCRLENLAAVFVHTHPFDEERPRFSPLDDDGERELAGHMDRRGGSAAHLAMVISPGGVRARVLGTEAEVPVWQIGREVSLVTGVPGEMADERFDRQERAFGTAGQRIVGALRVGVVGAGGTGSVLIQELAHLGVRDILVIDPDVVERTNLNRLLSAGPHDVGMTKVAVATEAVKRIAPDAEVRAIQGDVVDADVAAELVRRDFVFCCTDSHASRQIVAQIAYQHFVPAIDVGVSISVAGGKVTHVSGRVQMYAPGLVCPLCCGILDAESIRRETMTPEQRRADPYVQGVHEPQPAVVSLNSTMSSLAVTMFLGAVTPVPAEARLQLYDGIRGRLSQVSFAADPECIICSPAGGLARGVSWPLQTRAGR